MGVHCGGTWKRIKIVAALVRGGKRRYIDFMMFGRTNTMNTMSAITTPHWMTASTCMILLLCICVLAQMLGMPMTFFSLLASSGVFLESVSEDFSFPPTVPKPRTPSAWISYTESQSSPYLPLFVTSVFHPPQA